jgi:hypothetical protein
MANGNNNGKKINLKRYETDVGGVSLNTLEAGLWWTRNRPKFKAALIFFLIAISAVSWVYTLYGWGSYLLVGMNQDTQLARELVQTTALNPKYLTDKAAKSLILSPAGIINNNDSFDMYITVKNPNVSFYGVFSYCFRNAEKSYCGDDFILPGEQKYILALAKEFKFQPNNIIFSITNLKWQRINAHQIPDWKKYRDSRLDISVENTSFVSNSGEISGKTILNTLSFTASNDSPYSYWEAPFTIVLFNAGRVISINRYLVKDFLSHQSQDIKMVWPGIVGTADNISITPDINILDKNVYK